MSDNEMEGRVREKNARCSDVENNAHQPLNQTRAVAVRVLPPLQLDYINILIIHSFLRNSITIRQTRNLLVPADKIASVELQDGGVNRPFIENDRYT